jgi:hypothetical protein
LEICCNVTSAMYCILKEKKLFYCFLYLFNAETIAG